MQLLFNLIMDPYDDVRSSGAALLKLFPRSSLALALSGHSKVIESSQSLTDRADTMMCRSGRADDADGAGRLHELLFDAAPSELKEGEPRTRYVVLQDLLNDLEEDVLTAVGNLGLAVSASPIHGRLIALR